MEFVRAMLKKNVIILAGLFVIMTAGVCFAEKQKESLSNVCGGSPLVHFRMNDSSRTEFSIPAAYLNDEYNFYHKIKDPIGLIKLIAMREDLAPDCERVAWNHKIATNAYHLEHFIEFTIHHYMPDNLAFLLDIEKGTRPYFTGEENGYKIYRKKEFEKTRSINGEIDLMEPVDPKLREKYFATCSRGLQGTDYISCRVVQHIQKNIYADYAVKPDDVYQMEKWVNGTDDLIQNFIVHSAQENKN